MDLAIVNRLLQWNGENSRIRGQYKTSRLDWYIPKSNDIKDIRYLCLQGKNDFAVIEIEMTNGEPKKWKDITLLKLTWK